MHFYKINNQVIKLIMVLFVFHTNLKISLGLKIINRKEWGASPPTTIVTMPDNQPYVIIHHSAIPEACYTPNDCQQAMRSMQNMHQIKNKWSDIGYSFAIGGDGNIYEGRGFNTVGAHAPGYNDKSIGICLIGNWSNEKPPSVMIRATKKLIEYAVGRRHLKSNYILYGHRQVKSTECPGNELYNEIKNWPNFNKKVSS